MGKMIAVSFCVPVYNQWALVKNCIESILGYKGKDIEIVVSDDCSTERIDLLVKELNDSRIKYYRNEKNLGHDLNIIAAFKRSAGEFAFLLRSRDRMLSVTIPLLIKMIQDNKNISYLTGTAVNENNYLVLQYKNGLIKKGRDALAAHMALYIHPSGSAYRVCDLDLDYLEQFLKEHIETKYSFIAHNLFRMQLSQTGDFALLKEPLWIYTNTSNAKDVAVNSTQNEKSVYSSFYCNMRYECEMRWAGLALDPGLQMMMYRYLFKTYLNQSTWLYKLSNQDRRMQRHYNFKPARLSVREERNKFLWLTDKLEDQLLTDREKDEFDLMIKKELFYNRTIGAVKYFILISFSRLKLQPVFNKLVNQARYARRFK